MWVEFVVLVWDTSKFQFVQETVDITITIITILFLLEVLVCVRVNSFPKSHKTLSIILLEVTFVFFLYAYRILSKILATWTSDK